MGKQIVMSGIIFVKGSGNYQNFHEMCMKVFPNFTTIPFDYLLVSCLGWLDLFIVSRNVAIAIIIV